MQSHEKRIQTYFRVESKENFIKIYLFKINVELIPQIKGLKCDYCAEYFESLHTTLINQLIHLSFREKTSQVEILRLLMSVSLSNLKYISETFVHPVFGILINMLSNLNRANRGTSLRFQRNSNSPTIRLRKTNGHNDGNCR